VTPSSILPRQEPLGHWHEQDGGASHDDQDALRRAGPDAHLPADRRDRTTWRHVAGELAKATAGADPADVAIALRLVLSIEGVEYD